MLTLGFGLSVQVRCSTFLTVPTVVSRVGRAYILTFAIAYLLAGKHWMIGILFYILDALQAQRTVTNTKWFEYKTNIEVRTLTNRQPIQRYIAQGRLRWFGRLLRSPLNHPAHAIYTFNPRAAGWSRPRGTPRTRWSDVLGKDIKQLGTTLTDASKIAIGRSRWRSTIVARAVSTPSWQEP